MYVFLLYQPVMALCLVVPGLNKLCVRLCFDPQVENIEDQVREKLLLVQKGNSSQLEDKEKNELKKRKLLSEV